MNDLVVKVHNKGYSRWFKNKQRKKLKKRKTRDCNSCGGQAVWCICCNVYTQTCCVRYGTCMCS